MKKNFIRELTENAISNTDLALNVEGMSDNIQSMIEKITNMKTKDLAVLVKKIKYDNDIQKADDFQNNIGGKLDQLIQSMTEIKGEIDNVTVGMLNGEDSLGGSSSEEQGSDMGGIEDDFGEFNAEEEPVEGEDMGGEESSEEGSLEDLAADLEPVGRESK